MLRLAILFNAHRPLGRIALSVAGIALGVALGYAVHLVNRAAVEDVAAAVRSVAGEADIEVRGGRSGFPEALYPRIARLPGVRLVSPALELDVGVAGTEKPLRVIGLDILRGAVLQPALASEDRFELLSPDNVVLSAGAAAALGLEKGGALRLIVGSRAIELHVAGVLPASALRGQAALVDIDRAMALRAAGRSQPPGYSPCRARRPHCTRPGNPGAPAAGRARRAGGKPRAGERLS